MRKASIPVEITEEALEIYQGVVDQGFEESVAITRIQELLNDKGLKYSDRTISRLLQEWRKAGSIKSVVESFNVDLKSPYRRTEYILSILEEELRKSVEKNEDVYKKIRIADSMHKYILTEINIEVLRSKKTTSETNEDQESRVVLKELD